MFHFSRTRPDTPIVIICVGTDRSTGDSLGPLVGTTLARFRSPLFHLYGTLEEPVHAINLEETLTLVYQKNMLTRSSLPLMPASANPPASAASRSLKVRCVPAQGSTNSFLQLVISI
ncbi:DUF1256 domain-containing protein [Paenibacillus rhizoplanae]